MVVSRRGNVSKYIDDDGNERWRFRVDLAGGRGNRRQAKRQGFRTRREAVDALEVLLTKHVGVTIRTDEPLIAYLRRWTETRLDAEAIKPATADHYLERIGRLDSVLAAVTIVGLSTVHLDDAFRQLRREGAGPTGIRHIHNIVRRALDDAVAKGLIGNNPARGADVPSAAAAKPAERRVWDREEGEAFLDWEGLPDNRRAAWTLVLNAGMRCGELAALQWHDIAGDLIQIRRSRYVDRDRVVHEDRPKTAAAVRDIPLPSRALAELERWRTTQTDLFEQHLGLEGGPIYIVTNARHRLPHPNDLTRRFLIDARAAVTAGIVSFEMTLHDGRHWYATQLVANGVDMRTVAYLLGHTDPGFTLRTYGHTDIDRARAAAAMIDVREVR